MNQNNTDLNKVVNRPVSCIYCGSQVIGKTCYTAQGQQIKWICERCNQLVKVGNV